MNERSSSGPNGERDARSSPHFASSRQTRKPYRHELIDSAISDKVFIRSVY